MLSVLRRLLRQRESSIFLALLGIVVLVTFVQPKFATATNLYLVSRQIAFTAIVAMGVFFVILTSGIDLSVGSVLGLSGVACGLALASGMHPLLGVVVGLLTGAALGAINGAIVAYVGVTPFIVTLGMLSIARGAVLVLTKGDSVREIPESFMAAGLWDLPVLNIPVAVLVLLFVAAFSHVLLKYTVFGRRVYAVGGNEEATELSGIDVRLVKFFTYVISGAFASITGMLYICRFRSAQASAGLGLELDAIAAAVIGGTSLLGGEGSVAGVLIGAMIMGVVRNGLVLMQVSTYWQKLVIGSIIGLAAVIDVVRRRRSAR
ncbi:MAG: ABC transporter permease [Planctomycetota bacterium]|jgi:ribose transport system permease protein